jgi:uncharacterized protein YndB with AHSA1/START domain
MCNNELHITKESRMPDDTQPGVADRTIECEVLIDAPAEVVWRTITEPDQITKWFADRVQLDLQSGGAGTLVFQGHACTAEATTAPLVVVAVDPPRRFSFRWSHPGGEVPGPGNSVLVEFSLTAQGDDRTRLRVVETGLDGISWPEDEKARYVDDHRGGWATHLGRLEDLFRAPAR